MPILSARFAVVVVLAGAVRATIGCVELVAGFRSRRLRCFGPSNPPLEYWVGGEFDSIGGQDCGIQVGKLVAFGKKGCLSSTNNVSDGDVIHNDSLVCSWMFGIELTLDVEGILTELIGLVRKGKGNGF